MSEFESEEVLPERKPSPVMRGIAAALKWLAIALILFVFGTMLWRIFAMERIPEDMTALLVNDATVAAYEQGDGALEIFTQEDLDRITTNERAYGYFWVDQVLIIPEAKQVQVLVKYNDSTLPKIEADYELAPKTLSREDQIIDLTLCVIKDATPNDPEDNEKESAQTKTRIAASAEPVSGAQDVYNYRKFIFDGVELTDDVLALTVDFYYIDDVDYEKEPYGTLYVYYYLAENTPVALSKNDIQALQSYEKTPENGEN